MKGSGVAMRPRQVASVIVIVGWLFGRPAPARGQSAVDDFFIISSINPARHQLLVKHPTEVTQVMSVDADTKYIDRSGKAISLTDLRAGDTVYIRVTPGSARSVALEVRKGPMTLGELRKRYLRD
jgi:hypothetical protein